MEHMSELDNVRVKLSDGSITQDGGALSIPADLAARLNAPSVLCTHPDGCAALATHQTARPATDDEAAAHWDGLEQNIRSSGNPEYVQNRNDTATVAEHRCDEHADPAYLEALARQEQADG